MILILIVHFCGFLIEVIEVMGLLVLDIFLGLDLGLEVIQALNNDCCCFRIVLRCLGRCHLLDQT